MAEPKVCEECSNLIESIYDHASTCSGFSSLTVKRLWSREVRNCGFWWGYVTTGTFKFWLWSMFHPGWRWD